MINFVATISPKHAKHALILKDLEKPITIFGNFSTCHKIFKIFRKLICEYQSVSSEQPKRQETRVNQE